MSEIALEMENYGPVRNMNPHSCAEEARRWKLVGNTFLDKFY